MTLGRTGSPRSGGFCNCSRRPHQCWCDGNALEPQSPDQSHYPGRPAKEKVVLSNRLTNSNLKRANYFLSLANDKMAIFFAVEK